MIWISFAKWPHSAGKFFFQERIYWYNWKWTPFTRIKRRYDSWLGYWKVTPTNKRDEDAST